MDTAPMENAAPLMLVLAGGPIAESLTAVGRALQMRVDVVDQGEAESRVHEAAAVVVASHLPDEIPVLAAALRAGVPYVALIANRRRSPAVLAALDVDDSLREKVRTPAGLEIGARTPPEIAVSILAEIVSLRPRSTDAIDCVVPPRPSPAV
ncbi:xanthine/CO dehydrogenase XdhC/CoxF family maturation factor [Nakamurella sp. UYEF19]|uniref:XdhC family protein n=1 Tax=Nakamurella sp. UYEF19 TaxID=1756392 RepID=UPI003398A171